MTEQSREALQAAYNLECGLIGEAYTIIQEQKTILKAATARRAQLLRQSQQIEEKSAAAALVKSDESHNDRK